MRRSIIATTVLAALAVAAPAAQAAPDRTGSVSLTNKTFAYEGLAATGLNFSYFNETARPASCGKSVETFCDTALIHVDDTYTGSKKLNVLMDGFDVADYDLRVYKSDAAGTRGGYEGNPTGMGTGGGALLETFAGDHETKDVLGVKAQSYYLVDVVYFSATPAETPNVTVTLK